MENREILVANTKTQKRSKLITSASTLGELKTAMDAAGIDYSGMTFTEGISKTQLLDDSTQLPQNVMYKGNPTNNLVILLTNTKKNISSGAMSRKEAYLTIKEHNLQNAIKEEFGRNFTQVPTYDLECFINNNINFPSSSVSVKKPEVSDTSISRESNSDTAKSLPEVNVQERITDSFIITIDALLLADVIDQESLHYIVERIGRYVEGKAHVERVTTSSVSTSDGNITDSDIDDMISELD